MNRSGLLLAIIVTTIALSGCSRDNDENMSSSELSKWIGKNVIIQFRRDALGAAASSPISPNTGSINGASTFLSGSLQKVDATGIVIGNHQRPTSSRWIPREVILFVELNP